MSQPCPTAGSEVPTLLLLSAGEEHSLPDCPGVWRVYGRQERLLYRLSRDGQEHYLVIFTTSHTGEVSYLRQDKVVRYRIRFAGQHRVPVDLTGTARQAGLVEDSYLGHSNTLLVMTDCLL